MQMKKVLRSVLASVLMGTMMSTTVFAAPSAAEEKKQLESQKSQAQSELASFQQTLNKLVKEANDLELKLADTGEKVEQAKADLAQAQDDLKKQYEAMKLRIKYLYENGNSSALDRIFSSGSIADLLTEADYAEKVYNYDRNKMDEFSKAVKEVEDRKAALEEEVAQLQKQEEQYKQKQDEVNRTIESKKSEISNLDTMIQAAAKRAAEEAAKKAAEEAARKAAEEAKKKAAAAASARAASATSTARASASTSSSSSSSGSSASTGSSQSQQTSDAAPSVSGSSIVSRAYSQLGKPYVWGATGPSAFDCSGFVSYCVTGSYTRVGTSYTFYSLPAVSDPQPGDIAVKGGHVGIYIGNGQMIHAADVGIGVIIGPVQSGMKIVRY